MQLEYYLGRTISLRFPVQRKIYIVSCTSIFTYFCSAAKQVCACRYSRYMYRPTHAHSILYSIYITQDIYIIIIIYVYTYIYIYIVFICESVMHNVYICSWNILTARNILTACFSNCSPDMCSPSEFSCILTAFTYFWIFYLLVPYYKWLYVYNIKIYKVHFYLYKSKSITYCTFYKF